MCSEQNTLAGESGTAYRQCEDPLSVQQAKINMNKMYGGIQQNDTPEHLIYSQTHESIEDLQTRLKIDEQQVVRIDTFEETSILTQEQIKEDKIVFYRGQSNAAWVYRPSLQREFLNVGDNRFSEDKDCPAWNHVLEEYWKSLSLIKPLSNSQEKEAYMQHYGQKTILLDFCEDFLVALYFATCEATFEDSCSARTGKSIRDYASILCLSGSERSLPNWEELNKNSIPPFENKHDEKVFFECMKKWAERENSSNLNIKHNIVFISQAGYRKIFNLRMERQRGVLLYVGNDRWSSLEGRLSAVCDDDRPKVKLYLINKKLCRYLNQWLSVEKGINAQSLGLVDTPTIKISGEIRFTCNYGQ
ncbi:MAG: FRG domain-containing protein [Akkermansia sp.]|nr:FRG domain-containing protein [Akkermansia sp.]